jgi:hypothetical protein
MPVDDEPDANENTPETVAGVETGPPSLMRPTCGRKVLPVTAVANELVDARFLGREEEGDDTDVALEGAGDGPSGPCRSIDATDNERRQQRTGTVHKGDLPPSSSICTAGHMAFSTEATSA